MGRQKFNATERNIYALDYNCHPGGALASGFIGHVGDGLIHLLLVIAVVVLVINLIQGRRRL
jgi:hypothetical protein